MRWRVYGIRGCNPVGVLALCGAALGVVGWGEALRVGRQVLGSQGLAPSTASKIFIVLVECDMP